MNYYERIQNSIYYIEDNLDNELNIEDCAKKAYMSVSNYYRMFLSIVGYNIKEYIRLRRLSLAYSDLEKKDTETILDIAVKYFYNSADSFTRAFKKQFGILPSEIRKKQPVTITNRLERINIMEQFFETENTELLEKYPDIKVIRELPDMKVACFTYFGDGPEGEAFKVIKDWVQKNNIKLKDSAYRVFGYNNPGPTTIGDPSEEYGYEVCVTIPDALYETLGDVPDNFTKGTYNSVKRRILKGGKYAVMSVKRTTECELGESIMYAWMRFSKWMDEGKYIYGANQYLEEHLGFDDSDVHEGGVELYLSVETAPIMKHVEKKESTMKPFRAAVFRNEGGENENLYEKCWDNAISWAKKCGIKSEECHIYQYNNGFYRRAPFFHVVVVTIPDGFDETSHQTDDVTYMDFPGGKFITAETDRAHLIDTWRNMEVWRKETKTPYGKQQWLEEWKLKNWSFPETDIIVNFPIK